MWTRESEGEAILRPVPTPEQLASRYWRLRPALSKFLLLGPRSEPGRAGDMGMGSSAEGQPDLAYGHALPCSSAGQQVPEPPSPHPDSASYLLTTGSERDWSCSGGVWKKEMIRAFKEVLVCAEHFHIPTFY